METVVIVVHLMVVIALVGVVLLQRSEGGGLGIGGGSGFMTARGAANALTRTTAILAAAFFVTSIALGVIAKVNEKPEDILNRIPVQTQPVQGGDETNKGGGIFDQLAPKDNQQAPAENGADSTSSGTPSTPQVPSGQ